MARKEPRPGRSAARRYPRCSDRRRWRHGTRPALLPRSAAPPPLASASAGPGRVPPSAAPPGHALRPGHASPGPATPLSAAVGGAAGRGRRDRPRPRQRGPRKGEPVETLRALPDPNRSVAKVQLKARAPQGLRPECRPLPSSCDWKGRLGPPALLPPLLLALHPPRPPLSSSLALIRPAPKGHPKARRRH